MGQYYIRRDEDRYIAHSTGPWKKHKYLKKIGDGANATYVYAQSQMANAGRMVKNKASQASGAARKANKNFVANAKKMAAQARKRGGKVARNARDTAAAVKKSGVGVNARKYAKYASYEAGMARDTASGARKRARILKNSNVADSAERVARKRYSEYYKKAGEARKAVSDYYKTPVGQAERAAKNAQSKASRKARKVKRKVNQAAGTLEKRVSSVSNEARRRANGAVNEGRRRASSAYASGRKKVNGAVRSAKRRAIATAKQVSGYNAKQAMNKAAKNYNRAVAKTNSVREITNNRVAAKRARYEKQTRDAGRVLTERKKQYSKTPMGRADSVKNDAKSYAGAAKRKVNKAASTAKKNIGKVKSEAKRVYNQSKGTPVDQIYKKKHSSTINLGGGISASFDTPQVKTAKKKKRKK